MGIASPSASAAETDTHARAVAAAREAAQGQMERHSAAEATLAAATAAHEKAQRAHSGADEAAAAARAEVTAAQAGAAEAEAAEAAAEAARQREEAAAHAARAALKAAEAKQRELVDMRASESALDRAIEDLMQQSRDGSSSCPHSLMHGMQMPGCVRTRCNSGRVITEMQQPGITEIGCLVL